MNQLLKNKRGVMCKCCKRIMKLYYKSYGGVNICKFCYSNCESVTGIPHCHIERRTIGGYWESKRSDTFTKLDGTTEKRAQKEYFKEEVK